MTTHVIDVPTALENARNVAVLRAGHPHHRTAFQRTPEEHANKQRQAIFDAMEAARNGKRLQGILVNAIKQRMFSGQFTKQVANFEDHPFADACAKAFAHGAAERYPMLRFSTENGYVYAHWELP